MGKSNLLTLKIKYQCDDNLLPIIKQYNSVYHFTYNRLFENPKLSTKEVTKLQKSLNNCGLIGSHLKNSSIYQAKEQISDTNSNKPIIFGGKKNFLLRCQNKITHEEFMLNRLTTIYSVGEANRKGNRLFDIIDINTIIFKLDRHHHYTLHLDKICNKRIKLLNKLIEIQNNCIAPLTFQLDLDYVYITYDYNFIKNHTYSIKQNRVIAIDLNPNSIGWSVVDWNDNYKVIQAGTYSLKPLNDYRNSKSVSSDSDFHKYITNKRKHEIIHIAKELFKLCKHYKCEIFAIEDLNMSASNKGKGRRFNKLVNNNWCRTLLAQQITKHINSSSTTLVEVQPQWNSYIGNLVFRQEHLPDECLASIEIGRRGYEFANQYIFNRRPYEKTVIYPKLEQVKNQLTQSLEELCIDVPCFNSWQDILSVVKKSGVKYRFSTSDAQNWHSEGLFSKFYKNRYLYVYTYL